MAPPSIRTLASETLARARARGVTITTAESCTGGLVAAALTAIPGSSDVFDRGFVTYSNASKKQMLGVPERILETHGAVSGEVVRAMAVGALKMTGAGLAVSISGVAGPGGGSPEKPVGLVYLAAARSDGSVDWVEKRFGNIGRAKIRQETVRAALKLCLSMLESNTVQQT